GGGEESRGMMEAGKGGGAATAAKRPRPTTSAATAYPSRGDNVRRGGASDGTRYRRVGYVACVLFEGCFMQPSHDGSSRPIPAKLFLPSGAKRRCARPRESLDLVGAERPGALRDDRGDDRLLVELAALQARRLLAQVVIAPLAKRGQRDVQVETLLRQVVLVSLRALAIEDPFEHAVVDEQVAPVGQDVAGDSQALLQFVEAVQAQQHVADDQQRPALADDLERSCDRAVLAFVVTVQHRHKC